MSLPRVADDFPAIRARMHELRRESTARSRAADDFAAIRGRIDELRRERNGSPPGNDRAAAGKVGAWPAAASIRHKKG